MRVNKLRFFFHFWLYGIFTKIMRNRKDIYLLTWIMTLINLDYDWPNTWTSTSKVSTPKKWEKTITLWRHSALHFCALLQYWHLPAGFIARWSARGISECCPPPVTLKGLTPIQHFLLQMDLCSTEQSSSTVKHCCSSVHTLTHSNGARPRGFTSAAHVCREEDASINRDSNKPMKLYWKCADYCLKAPELLSKSMRSVDAPHLFSEVIEQ